jgi:translation initiation factor 1 (eIF-1/SUI1)
MRTMDRVVSEVSNADENDIEMKKIAGEFENQLGDIDESYSFSLRQNN